MGRASCCNREATHDQRHCQGRTMSGWGGRKIPRLRSLVIQTYGRTCHLCHQPILGQVSIDHVIPRSEGGTDDIENLRPACLACNVKRGTKPTLIPLATSTKW